MRKTVSLLLVIVVLLSLSGCGSTESHVKAWSKAVEAIKASHDTYTTALDKGSLNSREVQKTHQKTT